LGEDLGSLTTIAEARRAYAEESAAADGAEVQVLAIGGECDTVAAEGDVCDGLVGTGDVV